jgi:hypothetical protein
MEIKATGLPETIEDYQVALNAAFAGGKAYGLAQRTWIGLTDEEDAELWKRVSHLPYNIIRHAIEAKLKEKNT